MQMTNVCASDINTSSRVSSVPDICCHAFSFLYLHLSCSKTNVFIFIVALLILLILSGQTPQLISPRMVTPGSAGQQTTPGKLSRLQIPVTLTINSPSNLQSITSSAPGVSTLNVTPSNVQPATAPGDNLCSFYFLYCTSVLRSFTCLFYLHFVYLDRCNN